MSARLFTSFLVIGVFLLSRTVDSEILNYDNPDCVIDDSLPPEEEGNYVDCNTPEAIADNKTRCCQVEDSKGCCTNETNANKMVAIGTSIAVITVAIGTACFVVFWCNPDTLPCLKKCPCKCCHRGTNEFSGEMTDLTEDIKKIGIQNQNYLREPEEDEFAPPERYDMPEELKGKVEDDWWGSPQGAAF